VSRRRQYRVLNEIPHSAILVPVTLHEINSVHADSAAVAIKCSMWASTNIGIVRNLQRVSKRALQL
jgi:hypothetical protein